MVQKKETILYPSDGDIGSGQTTDIFGQVLVVTLHGKILIHFLRITTLIPICYFQNLKDP
jgi:hypothetical protein